MPDFWQFPTGSMGLGPINAIYQARFMRYLQHRGLLASTAGGARSGASSATARWTSPNRWPG
jgi:pyruvate dehydrogenase complex dehydrogenase (E1) component